jgi:NTP pyrophosphatase (non-canonical NTP hydrolase)
MAASVLDSDVKLINKILKLIEENGELSQAFLALANTGNKSKSASTIQEEAIDVLLVALDIALVLIKHQSEFLTIFLTDGFLIGSDYFNNINIDQMQPKDAFDMVFTIQKEITKIHELFESMDNVDRTNEDHKDEIAKILNAVLKSLIGIMGDAISVILISGINNEELNLLFNKKTTKWLSKSEANHTVGG